MNDRSVIEPLAKPTRGGLPPGVAMDAVRRRLLEGALRLFATQGFHGSSMRELAKIVAMQPSALYTHFPSKEHILAELVRVGHEAHQRAIRGAMLEAGADPVAQLRALVAVHIRFHATYPQLAIVINQEMDALPSDLAAPGCALRQQSGALLVEVIERGVAKKRFRPSHPYLAATAIGAMGLRVPYWYSPAVRISMDALVSHHIEMALRIVGVTTCAD